MIQTPHNNSSILNNHKINLHNNYKLKIIRLLKKIVLLFINMLYLSSEAENK